MDPSLPLHHQLLTFEVIKEMWACSVVDDGDETDGLGSVLLLRVVGKGEGRAHVRSFAAFELVLQLPDVQLEDVETGRIG